MKPDVRLLLLRREVEFPRPRGRGPIEAGRERGRTRSPAGFPRPRGRGPIEARHNSRSESRARTRFPRPRGRGPIEAWRPRGTAPASRRVSSTARSRPKLNLPGLRIEAAILLCQNELDVCLSRAARLVSPPRPRRSDRRHRAHRPRPRVAGRRPAGRRPAGRGPRPGRRGRQRRDGERSHPADRSRGEGPDRCGAAADRGGGRSRRPPPRAGDGPGRGPAQRPPRDRRDGAASAG